MSTYTKKEYVTISNAIYDACTYINMAYHLLSDFHERYFEKVEDYKILSGEVAHRPEMVGSQIYAILHILSEGKKELDVFDDPSKLDYYFRDAEKKKEIIKNYMEEIHGEQKNAG